MFCLVKWLNVASLPGRGRLGGKQESGVREEMLNVTGPWDTQEMLNLCLNLRGDARGQEYTDLPWTRRIV